MSSADTPILTSDGTPEEEKIRLQPEQKGWSILLVFMIIWCMFTLGMTVVTQLIFHQCAYFQHFFLYLVLLCFVFLKMEVK